MSPDVWTAVGTMGLFGVTTALALYARTQIKEAKSHIQATKNENKKWKTLAICNLYDTDPVIDLSCRNIRNSKLSGEILTDGRHLKTDANVILNYLDGVAIGIEQNLYIEELARDHLAPMVRHYVAYFLDDATMRDRLGLNRDHYAHLIGLHDRWSKSPPGYHDDPD